MQKKFIFNKSLSTFATHFDIKICHSINEGTVGMTTPESKEVTQKTSNPRVVTAVNVQVKDTKTQRVLPMGKTKKVLLTSS